MSHNLEKKLNLGGMMNFKVGQRYVSQSEPTLGLGIVTEVQDRIVKISFPAVKDVRCYRSMGAPVDRFELSVGDTAKSEKGVSFTVDSVSEVDGLLVYKGRAGRSMKESELNAKISIARPSDLFKALMENRVITFDYQSLTDSKPSPRRVQPWQLIYDNGNWNLHALDVIKNGRRRYSLGEMKNIQLTNEIFTLPKDYDFRKMTMGAFGCMCHDEKLDFKIHLHGYAARYAKNRLWGEN